MLKEQTNSSEAWKTVFITGVIQSVIYTLSDKNVRLCWAVYVDAAGVCSFIIQQPAVLAVYKFKIILVLR